MPLFLSVQVIVYQFHRKLLNKLGDRGRKESFNEKLRELGRMIKVMRSSANSGYGE
jgi:hypothetical protein